MTKSKNYILGSLYIVQNQLNLWQEEFSRILTWPSPLYKESLWCLLVHWVQTPSL